ncbi:hypothetical protein Ae201684P_011563 [Aphanomyces euteiches]|uniref:t-SNARE coiled-coil homology domain-containing protein n=1 Tax=Aphanomyces euteiches TaxID=100861 RepID=A0A6G0XYF4_9STRA|nr:hypothetical protein Ae201684_000226 [Aphanomyces euteiches]KAH9092024.1 hypothetical protein Ae201684P_011563 [Aphanomyces euteiches]KAH9157350.1 hypothetical protein AeRB84_000822 [Aphanomyces euteiches]
MAHRDLTMRFREQRRLANRRHPLRIQAKRGVGYAPSVPRWLAPQEKEHILMNVDLGASRAYGDSKPEWTELLNNINTIVRQLELKMDFLQKIHTRRLMVRFDESEAQHDHDIDMATREILTLFRQSENALNKISSGSSSKTSVADRQIRMNIQRSLASKLQEMSSRFRRTQREFMNTLKDQQHKFDPFYLEDGLDRKSSRTGDAAYQLAMLSDESYSIQAREKEIQRIAKSIVDLSIVFKEVANMVIDQGTVVDCIDYNMTLVVSRMESGLRELHRAEKYQSNSRSTRCIHILLALIAFFFCVLVLKHSGR